MKLLFQKGFYHILTRIATAIKSWVVMWCFWALLKQDVGTKSNLDWNTKDHNFHICITDSVTLLVKNIGEDMLWLVDYGYGAMVESKCEIFGFRYFWIWNLYVQFALYAKNTQEPLTNPATFPFEIGIGNMLC
jgi:hypothetical protein